MCLSVGGLGGGAQIETDREHSVGPSYKLSVEVPLPLEPISVLLLATSNSCYQISSQKISPSEGFLPLSLIIVQTWNSCCTAGFGTSNNPQCLFIPYEPFNHKVKSGITAAANFHLSSNTCNLIYACALPFSLLSLLKATLCRLYINLKIFCALPSYSKSFTYYPWLS